ncbi:uncharacterized protein K02A2.6-like [Wyeomyia smithii]|uniref:uncharacterized protein K02A2.6-like n=1 Tax=Wyeomyia smithii TaxID=174621 RepID=UPI002467E344|nr:uncharacterized protein K02A2.6-like [Wyeomyia smithii]
MEDDQPHYRDADHQRTQQQQSGPAGHFIQSASHQQQAPLSSDNLLAQMMHMMQQQQLQYQQQLNQLLLRQQQNEQRSEERFLQSEERQQALFHNIASSINVQVPPNPEQILDSLAGIIKEFHYEAESNLTFAGWYSRYDDLFEKDASLLDDEAKVRLLLRKMGAMEHERYVSFILPKLPKDFSLSQTVEKLKGLFGAKESVISRRYRCLQVSKNPTEDHIAFACRVNKSCVQFELGKLTEEEFKCLIYVCGLKSESDAELRIRLLSKIEERDNVTLEQLSEESQRLVNLRHDNAMIECTSNFGHVNAVKQFNGRRFRKSGYVAAKTDASENKNKPKSQCWFCGSLHYARDCTFRSHKCSDCGQMGHREGYCSSAKKSRGAARKRGKYSVTSKVVTVNLCSVESRRRFVSVSFPGGEIQLQLDTASDITVISQKIWQKIGSPVLVPATVKAKTARKVF